MKCKDFWEKYEKSGLIPDLEKHLEECESCRNEMKIELLIEKKVKTLPGFKAPEDLWEKIIHRENFEKGKVSLSEKIKEAAKNLIPVSRTFSLKPAVAAATFILLIAVGIFYYNRPLSPEERMRLQAEAAAELEETERDYIAAIEKFSSLVEDRRDNIDPELYQLYQEKLTILDGYIEQCKEAIAQNEYNINARQYLAIAYKEKVKTLKEMSEKQFYF